MVMARKIVLPPQPNVIKRDPPSLMDLLNSIQLIMGQEIQRISERSSRGLSLTQDETRTITTFMKTLIDLGRLNLDKQKADDLSKLTDAELAALGAKALKKIKDDLRDSNYVT
jgi:flagellar biosynthesis/type III secretory pathway chaperone